jgi:hypothetical protein
MINKKYGLVCVKAEDYLADIPEKNLAEIEAFKVRDEDRVFTFQTVSKWYENTHNFQTREELTNYLKSHYRISSLPDVGIHINDYIEPLYISCPPQDARIEKGYSVREDGFVLKDPVEDPIVLQPVKGGFLIVTKWGLEGSDPALVNETMN